ncbi:hypothetical protein [Lewinella sp. 4G2]|uniref:Ppx/GppA phosphatase family protein n=1 Tax=Lewinella sp. 4G2 TaxID=1803372 RepID=UPI0007B4EF20|nr:hypothetical protein [Lewinella sp. 4G2]OAV45595.1 hypothetical protein A3850_014325 [Lewinella sp. 4G2]
MTEFKRRAVIDLGTNTFHLLIADLKGDQILEVYRERIFVKLAEDGIETLGANPFRRGLNALVHFAGKLKEHDCDEVTAFGTAALRTASNGNEFVKAAQEEAGINIQLIPGDEEARLITKGVLAAIPALEERVLIMDIGGGSTEFIIADDSGVYFRESYPIGVSVLYNGFHHSNPITWEETVTLQEHLRNITATLQEALIKHPTHHLVGAAGTFDVLATVLQDHSVAAHPTSHQLELSGLKGLQTTIIKATLQERLAMPGIPEQRADMVVVAMILLDFIIQIAGIQQITVSDWAMKEGILLDQA